MKNKKIIGFDMDGVLFNFANQFAKYYNERYRPRRFITEKDIINGDWDVNKTVGHRCNDIWNTPGFFETMPEHDGMAELFRWCYERYHTVVVTNGPHHLHNEKVNAMKRICPDFNDWDIIFTNRKELVAVDVLVDDAPHNILALGERAIAYAAPYNSDISCGVRVSCPEQLKRWICSNMDSKPYDK